MLRTSFVASLLLSSALAAPALAATYTVLNAPDAGTASGQGTIANEINSDGSVVGYYSDSSSNVYGFLRTPDGTFFEFAVDDGQTIAWGINEKGTISGTYMDPKTGLWHAFLAPRKGKFVTFDTADDNGASGVFDQAINKSGTVAGDYQSVNGGYQSFFRKKNGTITGVAAPGATDTLAWGINNAGTISGNYDDAKGNHGFLRATDGTFTEFDAPGAAGSGTIADRINSKGSIFGDYTDSSNVFHAYIRDPGGTFKEFETADAGTGYHQGTAGEGGINRHGTVAAVYVDSSNVSHGYVRRKNGSITEFDPPGSTYTYVWDINENGIVVGDYVDSSGVYHGYIRSP